MTQEHTLRALRCLVVCAGALALACQGAACTTASGSSGEGDADSSGLDAGLGDADGMTTGDVGGGGSDAAIGDADAAADAAQDTDAGAADEAPAVTITAPEDGALVSHAEALTLEGSASDDRDAPETLTAYWSSDIGGELGTSSVGADGATSLVVEELLSGHHTITVRVADSGGHEGSASVTVTVNTPPGAPQVAITPTEPVTIDDLVAAVTLDAEDLDRDAEALEYRWRWLVGGEEVEGLGGTTVPASETTRGEVWVVGVRALDGLTEGPEGTAQVTIGNSAPSCAEATLQPSEPTTGVPLTCSCADRTDPDDGPDAPDAITDRCVFVDAAGEELAAVSAVDGVCELPPDGTARGMQITCQFIPGDGDAEGEAATSSAVTVINSAPGAPEVALAPDAGTVLTAFTCEVAVEAVDADEDELSYDLRWRVNGFANPDTLPATLTASELVADDAGAQARGGDTVTCEAVADDGFTTSAPGLSNAVVLGNAPPSGGSVQVEPPTAAEGTVLTCQADGAADPDGDPVDWTYAWIVGGEVVAGQTAPTLDSGWFAAGQTVSCTATPGDGTAPGPPVPSSNEVLVSNTAPGAPAVSLSPGSGSVDTTFTCVIDTPAPDADGDDISYTFTWVVAGHANSVGLGSKTVVAGDLSSDPEGTPARGGDSLQCQVIASDGEATSPAALSPAVVLANSAPIGGSVSLVPAAATEATTLTCDAGGALDPDGDTVVWTWSWTLDGQPVPGATTATLDGASFDKHQTVACVAVPGDGVAQGAAVPSANSVTIDNSPPQAPGVALAPQEATVETELTCVIAAEAVDADDDPLSYTYQWLVEGYVNVGVDTATITPTDLVSTASGAQATGGDEVSCRVIATDDDGASSLPGPSGGIVLDNTAPSGGFVTLQPDAPTETSTVSCLAGGAVDPDGDAVTWTYAWFVNGEVLSGVKTPSLKGDHFSKGDLVLCVATPTDGKLQGTPLTADGAVEVLNTPPSQPVPFVAPAAGVVGTEFSCELLVESEDVDTAADTLTYEFTWVVDGYDQAQATGATVVPAEALFRDALGTPVRHGDAIRCQAVARDDEDAPSEPGESAAIVLGNSPPTGGAVTVDPATAAEGDILSCLADGAVDPDGDEVTWTYKWIVQGAAVAGQTGVELASDAFGAGQTVSCTATPGDGDLVGVPVPSSNSVLIDNSLPSAPVVALDPTAGQVITTFQCVVVTPSTDADGDAVTYHTRWFVGDHQDTAVPVGKDKVLAKNLDSDADGTPARGGDTIHCEVAATDGLGFSDVAVSPGVLLANTAPVGGVVEIDPPEAAEGVLLTCLASDANDPDFGDAVTWEYSWTVNGNPVDGADGPELASDAFGFNDLVACTATPTDGVDAGQPVPSANQVVVGNSVPSAPEAGISPAAGTVETEFSCDVVSPSVDPDGADVTYVYAWFVNDHLNQGVKTASVTPTALVADSDGTPARGGDSVHCRLRGSDGFGLSPPAFSPSVALDNSPPRDGTVAVTPEEVAEGGTLQCVPTGVFDPDGDDISFTYTWLVGDEPVAGQTGPTLSSEHFDKHDVVRCAALPFDGQDEGDLLEDPTGATVINTAPALAGAAVTPSVAPRDGLFTCTFEGWSDPDPADAADQVAFRWLLLGEGEPAAIEGATSATLSPAALVPGDQVVCEVTPLDSDAAGEPVLSDPATVVNALPTLESAELTPPQPFADSLLDCTPAGFADADNDPPEYTYAWLLNGQPLADQTAPTLSGAFAKGGTVRCVITPGDGFGVGDAVPSNIVTVLNSLPTVVGVAIAPAQATVCEPFTCSYEAVADADDADVADLAITWSWTVNGEPVADATGPALVIADVAPGDVAVCTVSAWDGTLDEDLLPVPTSLSSSEAVVYNTPPTLDAVELAPVDPIRGELVTCTATGFADAECDPPVSYIYDWTYVTQGEEFKTDVVSDTFDTSPLPPGTLLNCGAVAEDGYDPSEPLLADPVFIQNGPPSAPITGISAPDGSDGAVTCLLLTPAIDFEGLTYTYHWKLRGDAEFIAGESLPATQVGPCDLVACRAVASDGLAEATSEWAETVLPFGAACSDYNTCTDDSCADGGGCAHVDNAAACNDFNACTHSDTCSAGACSGQPYECVDDSTCTDNVCLGDGQCDFPHNTAPCDDLDPCSVNDTCAAGQCSGAPMDCSAAADQCNTAACAGGACELTPTVGVPCTDGDDCTYDDACAADGSCTGTWDIFACGCIDDSGCTEDTDACHIGKCNVEVNQCYAEVQLGLACDDGEACSHTDACTAAGICAGVDYGCDDDNPCTDDSCDGDGTCTHVPNSLGCDDGNACTTADQCADTVCVGGPAPVCDDGKFCTGVETCNPANGCVAGTPPVIDDDVDCTVDSCDEALDVVVNEPDHQACYVGDLCVTDTCDPQEGCVQSVTPDCCGNGAVEAGETCDDANDVSGDGCSDACACECDALAPRVCTQAVIGLPGGTPAVGSPALDLPGVSTSVASGDVDGDGDLDVVIGYRGGKNQLLLGHGTATPFAGATPTKITNDTHQTQAVVLVDINRDGHLDLVVGNDGQRNRLYLNNGTSAPFDQVVGQDLSTDEDATYSLAVGDVDQDGDPDVVAGNLFGANVLYLNSGDPQAPFAGVTPLAIGPGSLDSTRALLLGDYDHDGDLDLVAGNDGSANRLYPNLGAPSWFTGTAGVALGGGSLATFALAQGDVDRDGDLDVLGGVNGGDNILYFNTGPPNFSLFPQPIAGVAHATRALALWDLDQDGDDDLLEVNDGSSFYVFYNFGAPFPFFAAASGAASTDQPAGRSIAAGDFDGDGDSDLLSLDSGGKVLYYPGAEHTAFSGTVEPAIPGDAADALALAAGDIDRDGAPDVLAGGTGPVPLTYHRSNGSAAPWLDTLPRAVAFDLARVDGLATADFDHDGDLDVIAVSTLGSPRLIAGDGTVAGLTAAQPAPLGSPGEAAQSVAAGDVNHDGHPDVVAGGSDGKVRVYLGDGTANPFAGVAAIVVPAVTGPASRVRLADLDGDGDLDIAVAAAGGADTVIGNEGGPSPFSSPTLSPLSGVAEQTFDLAVGDVDGNGTPDLLVATDSGVVRYLTPAGALPSMADGAPIAFAGTATALALADVDRDGDLDLVLGVDGGDQIMLNGGGSDPFATGTATAVALASDALTRVLLAGDFDRDGAPDVVAAHALALDQLHTRDALLDLLPTAQCGTLCTAQPLDCDDTLFCTGVETCNDADQCLPGTPPIETDEIECTVAECDEDLDIVVQVPDDALCDTGQVCVADVCDTELGYCAHLQASDCCGNNLLESGEQCDDGGPDAGDGCTPECTCECELTGPFLCAIDDTPPFDATEDFDIGEAVAATAGALGDVDGDGDLDLVVAVDGAPNLLFLNNGSAFPFDQVTPAEVTGDQHASSGVALADVDADGDLDALFATRGGRTRLYLNNGTATPFAQVVGSDVTGDEHLSTDIAVADINRDGHLDVVVANDGQANFVYLGSGGATPFADATGSSIGAEVDPSASVSLGDVDGDGDIDAVFGGTGVTNRVYLNSGDPEAAFNTAAGIALDTDFDQTRDLALADVDGDGRLDFLVGNDLAVDRLYLNDYDWSGTPAGKPGDPIGTAPDATRAVVAADTNRDGRVDFAIGSYLNRTRLFLNAGGPAPFDGVVADDVTADNHATVDLLAGDIDGDGDVDLVAINAGQPSRSYLSRAAPEVEVVIDPALGGSSGDTWAAAVADINRDGSPDVLVGRRNQPNDLYRNNGSVSPFDGVLGSPLDTLSDDTRGVALGDLDHDGDLDAVIGNFGQPSRVHINDGSADPFAAGAPADITGDLHDTWDILLADLTGDGHLDAITINTGQVTRVYPGDGSANPFANTVGVSLGSDAHASRAAAVGDMDGDGDLDLVVANFGQPNRLYLLDHTAADPIAEAVGVNISGDAHNTMAIALADLNGDGSLDVIAGNGGHQDRVYFNNGSPEPFANAAGLDLTADVLPTRALAVGDIDGDGKLDVVVGHQSGAARLVLAPADGLPAAAVDVPGVTGSVKALVLARIDFDGDLDLFVGRSQQVDLVILNGPLLGTPPPEGCAGYCAPTPITCDDGNSCTVDACDTVLGCNASDIVFDCCGNGLPEQGEGCDDGNQEDGDGCSSSCLQEPN